MTGDNALFMTYCISKNKTQQTRFPSNKTFICVCMRTCVCLDLVLLLVRWVSVKRITTVSLLYPHTLSQRPTFTRPTFHAIQPPSSAPFNSALIKRESYLEYERQDNIFSNSDSVVEAGLKWSTYVCFLCVPLTNNPFRKVWMFLFLIWIKNNKHKSTLINFAANILLVQRYIYSFPSVLLWPTHSLQYFVHLCIHKAYKIQ